MKKLFKIGSFSLFFAGCNPVSTSWHTIIVSDKATDIVLLMVLNLNKPSKIANSSRIKPMKFMGAWWQMQIGNLVGAILITLIHFLGLESLFLVAIAARQQTLSVILTSRHQHGLKELLVEGWNNAEKAPLKCNVEFQYA